MRKLTKERMKIKLIATDLDGTFLTDKKEITPFTRKVIEEVQEQGICFVPATGRAFRAVPKEVLELGHTEYVITSNGAAVYSVSQSRRIYECLLSKESVEKILGLELDPAIALEAFWEGAPYSEESYIADPQKYGATAYGAAYVKRTRNSVKNIRLFIQEHAGKIDSLAFTCADAQKRRELQMLLEEKIPDIYVTSSVPHMLEVGHKDAGKGKTLRYLLDFLGISGEEAMAFGDADNDIDMLTEVRYGFAMENGMENCKKAAFALAGNNNEDGVAKEILKFIR